MTPAVIRYVTLAILGHIGGFFAHWYTRGSAFFWHATLDFFEELERMISLRITLLNWFRPLYQDYSWLGYFLGIPIRLGRIMLSLILYAVLFCFVLALFAAYLALPPFLVWHLAA